MSASQASLQIGQLLADELLQLAPGTYTLRLDTSDGGYQAPTSVTLVAGQLAAVGVYEQVP